MPNSFIFKGFRVLNIKDSSFFSSTRDWSWLTRLLTNSPFGWILIILLLTSNYKVFPLVRTYVNLWNSNLDNLSIPITCICGIIFFLSKCLNILYLRKIFEYSIVIGENFTYRKLWGRELFNVFFITALWIAFSRSEFLIWQRLGV